MDETTARLSTTLLRTSQGQPYKRLRELLPSQGVDLEGDVLADLFPDDVDQDFGVIVTVDRRVFTFVLLCYGRRGDLKAQLADARVGDWTDITEWWQASPYRWP
ncbi:hypothetical protein ABZX12_10960 [Kribbella sp. NPDC003505]|uniref:hypothetical protein n=1 Tax=Kribbella sp. NPDC003505 TaxID=3154448 RepID=UPI0033A998A3